MSRRRHRLHRPHADRQGLSRRAERHPGPTWRRMRSRPPSSAPVDPAEVEDVMIGCAMQQGTTGINVARQSGASAPAVP